MKSWAQKKKVQIRSPDATRPWQHVLEPLSGYLSLGMQLGEDHRLHGESFNFGPKAEQNRSVLQLLSDLSKFWDFEAEADAYEVTDRIPFHEAGLLKLNCDKALFHLHWESNLAYNDCVQLVSEWYFNFYSRKKDPYQLTVENIDAYERAAKLKNLVWTK